MHFKCDHCVKEKMKAGQGMSKGQAESYVRSTKFERYDDYSDNDQVEFSGFYMAPIANERGINHNIMQAVGFVEPTGESICSDCHGKKKDKEKQEKFQKEKEAKLNAKVSLHN